MYSLITKLYWLSKGFVISLYHKLNEEMQQNGQQINPRGNYVFDLNLHFKVLQYSIYMNNRTWWYIYRVSFYFHTQFFYMVKTVTLNLFTCENISHVKDLMLCYICTVCYSVCILQTCPDCYIYVWHAKLSLYCLYLEAECPSAVQLRFMISADKTSSILHAG